MKVRLVTLDGCTRDVEFGACRYFVVPMNVDAGPESTHYIWTARHFARAKQLDHRFGADGVSVYLEVPSRELVDTYESGKRLGQRLALEEAAHVADDEPNDDIECGGAARAAARIRKLLDGIG